MSKARISLSSTWDLRHILVTSGSGLTTNRSLTLFLSQRVICWFWLSDFCLTTDPSWRVNDLELFYVDSRLIWDWFSLSALFSTSDFFVHFSVGNVSIYGVSVSITYKGFLQNLAQKRAKLGFFTLITLSISIFYKLNVSFGDETDNSFYLAPRNVIDPLVPALWKFFEIFLVIPKISSTFALNVVCPLRKGGFERTISIEHFPERGGALLFYPDAYSLR